MQGSEQLSLERLVTVSVDDFEKNLKQWKYSFLAVYSGIKPNFMLKELARERSSKLLDDRRSSSLTDREIRKKDHFLAMAEDAQEYAEWVKERDLQPLIRDLFMSQCVGFENCLKTLAVAAIFCKENDSPWNRIVYVPSKEFNDAHKRVGEDWLSRHVPEEKRIDSFFRSNFLGNPIILAKYSGILRFDAEKWIPIWREIYRLRNAVAHSRARPSEQLLIDQEVFWPSEEAILTEFTLSFVSEAFQELIYCFRLSVHDI
jgi:hypothetical protein